MRPLSPTPRQLLGLGVTLAVVSAFAWFALHEMEVLRQLQTGLMERSRRDSLQLVRIQNDLTQMGTILRRIQEAPDGSGFLIYRQAFTRVRDDLAASLSAELRLMPEAQGAAARRPLDEAVARFNNAARRTFELADRGEREAALALLRTQLETERVAVSATIAQLLVRGAEVEASALERTQAIYNRVERNTWLLVWGVLVAISLTSFLVIRFNRRLFQRVAALSEQRRVLAVQLITLQEELFRDLSRELHDEFGQVLTAIGMMLGRAERHAGAPDRDVGAEVHEVREITQDALNRVRSMSHMLHPRILDDLGLEKSLEWLVTQFRRQTGLTIHFEQTGVPPELVPTQAIHIYRIVQEALTNVARHAKTQEAWVRAEFSPGGHVVTVEDHGAGLSPSRPGSGIGLMVMRERAALLGADCAITSVLPRGTRVRLELPATLGE